MSTKIHNGFVFNTTDLMEIYEHINEFRKQLQPLVYDKTVQYFAEECTTLYDMRSLSGEKIHGIFSEVYQNFKLKQDEVRVKMVRDPSVDFQFSITIIPTADKFYGLFYTEQSDFADMWADSDMVSEYVYYNNTDHPDGITEEEWDARGDMWDSLLNPFGDIPAEAGFTFSVIPEHTTDVPKIKDVVSNVTSITDRTAIRAKDNMFKRFCKDKKITGNNVMKIYSEFTDYMMTDEGVKKYDDEIGRMSSKLKLVLTEQEIL